MAEEQVQDQATINAPAPVQQMPGGGSPFAQVREKLRGRDPLKSIANLLENTPVDTTDLGQAIEAKADPNQQPPVQTLQQKALSGQSLVQQQQQPPVQQQVVPQNQQQPVETPPATEQAPVVEDPPVEEPADPNMPSVFTKQGAKTPGFGEEGWQSVKVGEYVQQKFQIEDPSKFIDSATGWRRDASKFKEMEVKHEKLLTDIEALPEPILNAIRSFSQGDDYIQAFEQDRIKINFNEPFENHGKTKIIEAFHPNWQDAVKNELKIFGDDMDEDKKSAFIAEKERQLYQAALPLFNQEKKRVENERVRLQQSALSRKEALIQSVTNSVDSLRDKWPSFGDQELKKIQDLLVKGDYSKILLDGKGNYKPDAALTLAWAIHGPDKSESQAHVAALAAESKANATNLRQGTKKNVQIGSQNPQTAEQTEASVAKKFNHFAAKQSPFQHNPVRK